MQYEVYTKGVYQVVKITKPLSLVSDITGLENVIHELLKKNRVHIAVHFMSGSYLHSGTAACLIYCWEIIRERHGTLALVNANEDILNFLKIMNFDSKVRIYNTEKGLELDDFE